VLEKVAVFWSALSQEISQYRGSWLESRQFDLPISATLSKACYGDEEVRVPSMSHNSHGILQISAHSQQYGIPQFPTNQVAKVAPFYMRQWICFSE